MNTRFRAAFILAAACGAMALSTVAPAGTGGMVGDVAREAKEKERARDEARAAPPRQQEQRQAPQPRMEAQRPPAAAQQRSYGGGGPNYSPRDRGGINGNIAGRTADRVAQARNGNGGNWNGGGHRPPPRYIDRLPGGYRQYAWNGRPYYHYGGAWYRPYGNRYVVVGAPYGLFVSYLPSYYSSFYFGDTRYFYADDTYYTYEPARRGYVVTRSPYVTEQDDEESADSLDDDLFIYPARGQSEQQQADDRYECHQWAAKETRYDPVDSDFDADKRADYQRAMTACLTGRGYSVK